MIRYVVPARKPSSRGRSRSIGFPTRFILPLERERPRELLPAEQGFSCRHYVQIGTAALLLTACAIGTAQEEVRPARARMTASPLWCRHTILIYISPSGRGLDVWTPANFEWLIAYRDLQGKRRGLFFDGFLFLGFGCKGGRHLLGVSTRKPAIASDWEDALTNYLKGVRVLSDTFGPIARDLEQPAAKAKVILSLPYPDPRQRAFQLPGGKRLDFRTKEDRDTAVAWYVDEALRRWELAVAAGDMAHAQLVGFYWGHEGLARDDGNVVKTTAEHIHSRGRLLHWIPSFGAGAIDWQALGIDCLTQQINYQNPQKPGRHLEIFEAMSDLVEEYQLHGVELTPTARETQLNPRIWCWHQVFLANLDAALRLGWNDYTAFTYFHGNDIPKIASDPRSHIFYEKLYHWIEGTLTRMEVEELALVVIDELQRRGHVDAETAAYIAAAPSVLGELRRMEEPKLAAIARELAERLAKYTERAGNLLRDASFEGGIGDWPVRSRQVDRADNVARTGTWSLRLSLEADKGSNMIRESAKSARLPVKPGQMIQFSVWANVPERLQRTTRGLMIGLARYRGGKMSVAWTDCEVRMTGPTNGWKQLVVHLFVDEKPCDEVMAIVGLCGGGTAYVDDAEVIIFGKPQVEP